MLVGVLGKGIVVKFRSLWLIDFEEGILIIEIGMASQQQYLYLLYLKALDFGQREHVLRVLLEEFLVVSIHFFRVVGQFKVKMYLESGP